MVLSSRFLILSKPRITTRKGKRITAFNPLMTKDLRARARKIKLLLMDVDGVMTDGRIYYLPQVRGAGGTKNRRMVETKTFDSRDGLGLRLAIDAGLKTGIISGRGSPVVEYRARELGIHFIVQDSLEKLLPYRTILRDAGLSDEEVCFIGDDIVDLPVLSRVGLAVGVGNGHPLLRRHVHYWTRSPGGMGAVRETIELILAAQGKLKAIVRRYLR
jgi:3-deoxy-D-manno-octulosonate 8-phosphate phosphatase (KDO 8-P phosphatase)